MLCTVAWILYGPPTHPPAIVVLVLLGVLSEAGPGNWVARLTTLSISSVVVLAAVAIVGPVGAAVVGSASWLARSRLLAPGSRALSRRALIFNMGMSVSCAAASGIAYRLTDGVDPVTARTTGAFLLMVGVPLMAADVVHLILNVCLLSGIQSVSRGAPFRAQATMLFTSVGMPYVAYGVIALVLVLLWLPAGVGPFSIVLIFAPLVAAQWALGRYGAEFTAHNRTLGALVAAVETKSPASTGQSAVVAELSEWVAEELALPTRDVDAARTAGMLHDVALLAVPVPLLDPGHVLTPDELHFVRGQASDAAGMLRGISFLDRALVGIVHHGERVDGTGYPSQLAGEQIPPIARIVAVADAYASLLTPRTDRPALTPDEALAVLRDLAGTAYDQGVVAALARALARHPERLAIPVIQVACSNSAVAHDDPPVRIRGVGTEPRPAGRDAAVSP